MKAILIGASLSGKTTLIRHLRSIVEVPISEMDEELTKENKGQFPTDNEYKLKVLAPKVIEGILSRDTILFFTNTDYFSDKDLKLARKNGFTIVQLDLNLDLLKERNRQRVQNEGYADLEQWIEGMVRYQNSIQEQGFVSAKINMNQPVEEIAKELLEVLNK